MIIIGRGYFLCHRVWRPRGRNARQPHDRSFESAIKFDIMTLREFNAIMAHNKLTLVDFYASWCGPCKAMHYTLDRLEERMRGLVDVVRIDIDHFENAELVEHFRIMAVPTLMIFLSGRKLWRESGVLSLESLSEVVYRYERVEAF